MKKELKLSQEDAQRMYPTASKDMKEVFESTFGKACFKNIDGIENFYDILDYLGEDEANLPHKNARTVEEKCDNSIWRLRKICAAYNLSLGKTVNRNDTNTYRYFPYIYLNGDSRGLGVYIWSCNVSYPAGLDFLSKNHAETAAKLFKSIFEDFYGVKL